EILAAINVIKQRFFAAVSQVHAPHGHRHDFRSGSLVGAAHLRKTPVLARAHNQARTKVPSRNLQNVVIHRFFQAPSRARGPCARARMPVASAGTWGACTWDSLPRAYVVPSRTC